MTAPQGLQDTSDSAFTPLEARIQAVSSYFNQNYNDKWSWKIDQLVSEDKKIACIGHILISGGRAFSGIAEINRVNSEYPYREAEVVAMEEAAKKFGWGNALHSASQKVEQAPEMGQKVQTKTQIRVAQNTGERAVELKEAYGMTSRHQFLRFVQVCYPDIQTFEAITPEVIDDVHGVALAKPELFKDFQVNEAV